MKVNVMDNPEEIGKAAAEFSANVLNESIRKQGSARLVLSTGKSQFDVLKFLVNQNIDWTKVEMFHLDEYVNLSEEHPASFRRYLKERFTSLLPLKEVHFVNGEGEIKETIKELNNKIQEAPIDLALIGIGENAHIAFNDPPANFDTRDPYITVNLDSACKQQQVREGWFDSEEEVPPQAITMTVYQILKSRVIVSVVPSVNKAKAIKRTLENELTNEIPATALKTHDNVMLYLDNESASLVEEETLKKFQGSNQSEKR